MRLARLSARLTCALGLAVPALLPGTAFAQGCTGSYAATALHPIPQPLVARLDVRDPSPENQVLAQRFLQGARDAGAKVDGPPTALISINYSVLGPERGPYARGVEHSYDQFGGFADSVSRSAPEFTGRLLRQQGQPPAPQPVMLTLRAELTRPDAAQVIWVLSLQCQVHTAEPPVLAYEIGQLVGHALGKTVPRQAF